MSLQPKTAEQALNPESQSLSIIKKELGGEYCKAFLTYIVTDLIQTFNVGKNMDINQVVFVVNAIESDYYYLRPDELKYCFDNAKKGKYGTTYNRVDAQVVFEWIEQYLVERNQVCYTRNIEQQKIDKKETEQGLSKILTSSKFKLSEIIKIGLPKPQPIIETKDEQQLFANKVFKEFDEQWLKELKQTPEKADEPIKIINYKNKILTQSNYLKTRIKENNDSKTQNSEGESETPFRE